VTDEKRQIGAIEGFLSVFKLIHKKSRNSELSLNSQIGSLIGESYSVIERANIALGHLVKARSMSILIRVPRF